MRVLMLDAYMYTFGSAGTCSTEHNNRAAFEKWRLVPRMLFNATERNVEVRTICKCCLVRS